MSTPKNPLADFNTYSYHHIFIACDTSDTAEELATISEPLYFQRDRDTRSEGKYELQNTPSGGEYIIVINGMTDADLIIDEMQWVHINSVSGATNELQGTAAYVEGTMSVIEPFGISFYNVLDKVSDNLQRDANGIVWMIKTIFVGNGLVEKKTRDRQYLSNIKPFLFYITDITSSFASGGGEYEVNFTGISNGAAYLPQHNNLIKHVPNINTSGGNTLKNVLSRLEYRLNDEYYKSYQKMRERLINLEVIKKEEIPFTRVNYKIVLDDIYDPAGVKPHELSYLRNRNKDGTKNPDAPTEEETLKKNTPDDSGSINDGAAGNSSGLDTAEAAETKPLSKSGTVTEAADKKGYYVLPEDIKMGDAEAVNHVFADGTIAFGKEPSILSAIKNIMDHTPKVIADATIGYGEGDNRKRYGFKILSTVVGGVLSEDCQPKPSDNPSTSDRTGEGSIRGAFTSEEIKTKAMGEIQHTVVFKIVRYIDPRRSDLLDRAKQSSEVVGDADSGILDRNTLNLDYIYTGKNIDILNFDMKMDMGLSFFQTITSTENQNTQQDSLSGHSPICEVLSTDMGLRGRKIRPRTPFFVGTKADNVLLKGKGNLSGVSSYNAALSRQAGLESMEAKVEIIGNPYLLGNLSKLPTEIVCGSVKLNSNIEDRVVEEQLYADWDVFPSLVKINVMIPSDPSREALQRDFEPFWFRENYLLFSIQNVFSGGEFRQVLDMVALPEQTIRDENVACTEIQKDHVTINYRTNTIIKDEHYDISTAAANLREVKREVNGSGFDNTDYNIGQFVCSLDIWDDENKKLVRTEIACTAEDTEELVVGTPNTAGYRRLHSQRGKNTWRDKENDKFAENVLGRSLDDDDDDEFEN